VPLYTADRPEVHDIIREMRGVVEEFSDRVLIGEIYLPTERLVAYYGRDLDGLQLPFNFALLNAPWQARTIAHLIDEYEAALPAGGWADWVLGNHDRPRIATRVGPLQAPVAAMLLLTLRGTPIHSRGPDAASKLGKIQSPQMARIHRPLRVCGIITWLSRRLWVLVWPLRALTRNIDFFGSLTTACDNGVIANRKLFYLASRYVLGENTNGKAGYGNRLNKAPELSSCAVRSSIEARIP
jgi:hypothetical protein